MRTTKESISAKPVGQPHQSRLPSRRPVITLQRADQSQSLGFGIETAPDEDLETIEELQDLLTRHGEAFAVFWNNGGVEVAEAADRFSDAYIGQYRTLTVYAQETVTGSYDVTELPDVIQWHIDYEGIARDMELEGSIWTEKAHNGSLFIYNAA